MLIDGLQCGDFRRDIFEQLRDGGFTCVTNTLEFWGGAIDSLDAIGKWLDLERANSDIMTIVRSVADIKQADADSKVGILMGFQNSGMFQGRIRFPELFAQLGVRVVQLTYNIQNDVGGSCYEPSDSGLTRFGREIIGEMNKYGMMVDCSHVGERTTLDAIEASQKPVAVTHANAASLKPHPRNKSDKVLRALAANGGIMGLAIYRNITPEAACDTVDGWAEMMARTVDIAGIDHVGVGTDAGHYVGTPELDWMRQGLWTRSEQYGAGSKVVAEMPPPPSWLSDISKMGLLHDALTRRGFSAEEVHKLTAGNWLRVYEANFG
ncbi:MAG: peptidase M19 [Confluentimicrobium sp.]|jgi:microsomal dipeptidase-like Zn-dependent dipeptidase|uniref:membrane dipeptidase n=1 Tax=Actibacterium sp. TaxID=1872125 RepID=UPI000C5A2738|nr:membrane dipeptidase [Actibacterium sp.]MBC57178.1 peptidase M19 [Actibacterium sp.]|tara:strand:- start:26895 stop:27860 length:966 start_codon:yes stop_codon:yes gene_type:complete